MTDKEFKKEIERLDKEIAKLDKETERFYISVHNCCNAIDKAVKESIKRIEKLRKEIEETPNIF